jgi:hypothetical protein
MQRRNYYAPSVADTMSVVSLPSVKGSVYGDAPYRNDNRIQRPPFP